MALTKSYSYGNSKTDSILTLQGHHNNRPLVSRKSLPDNIRGLTRRTADFADEVSSRLPHVAEGQIDRQSITRSHEDDRKHGSIVRDQHLGTGYPGARLSENFFSNYYDEITPPHARSNVAGADPPRDSTVGGFNTDLFLEDLDSKYHCGVCFNVLRDPVQTGCGHRFCESCVEQLRLTKPGATIHCPIDREPLTQVFKDNFCRREILGFRVQCSNYRRGCSWKGELRSLENHLRTCGCEVVRCPNTGCHERLLRRHIEEHLEKCSFRKMTCEHCKQLVPYSDLKSHVRDICLDTPKMCPYNCGTVVPRRELPRHLTECMEAISACSFREMGCKFRGTRREVEAHENDPASASQHLNLACRVATEKTNEMAILKAESERKESLFIALCSKVEQLELKLTQRENALEHRFQQLKDSIQTAVAKGSKQTDEALRSRVLSLESVSTTNEMNVNATQHQLKEIQSEIRTLSQQENHSLALADSHDLRLLGLETAAYDGVMIWKVNFDKAMADAKSGKKMSVYSPPFYTSRYGFKMCARLYPLGDGIGRSSHISFFFVVMSGDNDAILPWPFRQRVTLTLIDQSPARRDISETFLPDVSSSSFQRPTTGMNVASGCPRFASHELLESRRNVYIKDGIIFLKVSVDRTGLDQP